METLIIDSKLKLTQSVATGLVVDDSPYLFCDRGAFELVLITCQKKLEVFSLYRRRKNNLCVCRMSKNVGNSPDVIIMPVRDDKKNDAIR
jgi:hypothetical protein